MSLGRHAAPGALLSLRRGQCPLVLRPEPEGAANEARGEGSQEQQPVPLRRGPGEPVWSVCCGADTTVGACPPRTRAAGHRSCSPVLLTSSPHCCRADSSSWMSSTPACTPTSAWRSSVASPTPLEPQRRAAPVHDSRPRTSRGAPHRRSGSGQQGRRRSHRVPHRLGPPADPNSGEPASGSCRRPPPRGAHPWRSRRGPRQGTPVVTKPPKGRQGLARSTGTVGLLPRILIVCEGNGDAPLVGRWSRRARSSLRSRGRPPQPVLGSAGGHDRSRGSTRQRVLRVAGGVVALGGPARRHHLGGPGGPGGPGRRGCASLQLRSTRAPATVEPRAPFARR